MNNIIDELAKLDQKQRLALIVGDREPLDMHCIIAVHDGLFHADDVAAVALVQCLAKDATVVRTRDPKKIAESDIAIDVGEGMFDHHGARAKACGTVAGVTHCGVTLLAEALGLLESSAIKSALIPVAATDNGEVRPTCYFRSPFDVVQAFLPAFGEECTMDDAFASAVTAAVVVWKRIARQALGELRAADIVSQLPTNQQVVEIPAGLPGWHSKLVQSEALFVVFEDTASGTWRVQAVPQAIGDRSLKVPLPATWCGLSGSALDAATGIAGGVFVHAKGFIGGWVTKEAAVEAANKAIEIGRRRIVPSPHSFVM